MWDNKDTHGCRCPQSAADLHHAEQSLQLHPDQPVIQL